MSQLRKIVKSILPQRIIDFYRANFSNSTKWVGNFSSWEEALASTGGYSSKEIIEKVYNSTKEVVSGRAKYERDSVLFFEEEFDDDLIDIIKKIILTKSSKNKTKKVTVLDFGGALGSTYFKNKKLLSKIKSLNWCVVEQKEFAELGKKHFEDKTLKFYSSLDSFFEKNPSIDLVLFSSVLQYLENPFDIVNKVIQKKPLVIVVLRTPFTQGDLRICVQKVNPKIYFASYPCYIFNEKSFIRAFGKKYILVNSVVNDDYSSKNFLFKSFVFRRV